MLKSMLRVLRSCQLSINRQRITGSAPCLYSSCRRDWPSNNIRSRSSKESQTKEGSSSCVQDAAKCVNASTLRRVFSAALIQSDQIRRRVVSLPAVATKVQTGASLHTGLEQQRQHALLLPRRCSLAQQGKARGAHHSSPHQLS